MYKLREILKDNNIKNTDVAEILNIKSLSTVSLKINGKSEFTAKEASILKNYINEKAKTNYTIEDLFFKE